MQQVNHRFYDGVYEAKTDVIGRLHLGQFWSRLGVTAYGALPGAGERLPARARAQRQLLPLPHRRRR